MVHEGAPCETQALASQGGNQGCLLGCFMWNFLENQILAQLNYQRGLVSSNHGAFVLRVYN